MNECKDQFKKLMDCMGLKIKSWLLFYFLINYLNNHFSSNILNISSSISCILAHMMNECNGSPKSLSRNYLSVPLTIFYVFVPTLASPIHGVFSSKTLFSIFSISSSYFGYLDASIIY